MNQYLIPLHATADSSCNTQSPMPPEEMVQFMQRIQELETDMKSSGTWMFSGRLTEPESATVVRDENGDWQTLAPLSEARLSLSAVTAGGKALFAGGMTAIQSTTDIVNIYAPLGLNHCSALANSTGEAATISAVGSASLGANSLQLVAT